MSQIVCELCGGTEFKKDGDDFVCQGCGCRYSAEDARKLMRDVAPAAPDVQVPPTVPAEAPSGGDLLADAISAVTTVAGRAGEVATQLKANHYASLVNSLRLAARPVDANNAVCQIMGELSDEYRKIQYPAQADLQMVADVAGSCLGALDHAAHLEPDAHARNILLLGNCKEIMDWMQRQSYYVERDGERKHEHFTTFGDIKMPYDDGTSGSQADWRKVEWGKRAEGDREFLRSEYRDMHPDILQRLGELEAQISVAESELDDLKAEKKGKGFFNFSEKKEVKGRMEPVKERLAELRGQVSEIDKMMDNYIDMKVDEVIAAGFAKLDL